MSDQLEPELERVAQMLADGRPAARCARDRCASAPWRSPTAARRPSDEAVVAASHAGARRRPRPIALAGIAAAVAAIAIVPAVAGPARRQRRRPSSVDLVGAPVRAAGRRLRARRRAQATAARRSSSRVWKMPSAGSGRTYEAWLGRTGDRRALGTFSTDANGKATDHLPGAARGARQLPLAVGHERARRRQRDSRASDTALWGPLT